MSATPRVLSIQSHVVSGYVGNKSAVFPMQFEVVSMTTQEDQYCGTGILTKWVKGWKIDKSDFDQNAYSPIGADDSFIFYQHLKSEYSESNMQLKIITSNLSNNHILQVKSQDISKEPSSQVTMEISDKSSQTDHNYKEEDSSFLGPANNSPKSNTKSMNKYFTGAFTTVDKSKGCWILSNFYAKRDISQNVEYVMEKSEDLQSASSTGSLEDLSRRNVYRAKPSELREMNFWSPTSM